MAVKIGDKIYRNEQEQVRKNMEDIEFLMGKIKDVFKTTATLTSSSVSVALVDTNVTDEEEGWLMSEDGLLFAITGNDGTNLLISFYTDLKGPQGESGADLNIDDSTTSATKVWSSQKTSNEIMAKFDKGILYTLNSPVLYDGDYTVTKPDIDNFGWQNNPGEEDLLLYVDGNGKVKELWVFTDVNATIQRPYYLFSLLFVEFRCYRIHPNLQ